MDQQPLRKGQGHNTPLSQPGVESRNEGALAAASLHTAPSLAWGSVHDKEQQPNHSAEDNSGHSILPTMNNVPDRSKSYKIKKSSSMLSNPGLHSQAGQLGTARAPPVRNSAGPAPSGLNISKMFKTAGNAIVSLFVSIGRHGRRLLEQRRKMLWISFMIAIPFFAALIYNTTMSVTLASSARDDVVVVEKQVEYFNLVTSIADSLGQGSLIMMEMLLEPTNKTLSDNYRVVAKQMLELSTHAENHFGFDGLRQTLDAVILAIFSGVPQGGLRRQLATDTDTAGLRDMVSNLSPRLQNADPSAYRGMQDAPPPPHRSGSHWENMPEVARERGQRVWSHIYRRGAQSALDEAAAALAAVYDCWADVDTLILSPAVCLDIHLYMSYSLAFPQQLSIMRGVVDHIWSPAQVLDSGAIKPLNTFSFSAFGESGAIVIKMLVMSVLGITRTLSVDQTKAVATMTTLNVSIPAEGSRYGPLFTDVSNSKLQFTMLNSFVQAALPDSAVDVLAVYRSNEWEQRRANLDGLLLQYFTLDANAVYMQYANTTGQPAWEVVQPLGPSQSSVDPSIARTWYVLSANTHSCMEGGLLGERADAAIKEAHPSPLQLACKFVGH